jgi:hypothetical protein
MRTAKVAFNARFIDGLDYSCLREPVKGSSAHRLELHSMYKFEGVARLREHPFPGPCRCNAQLVHMPVNIGLGFDCQVHEPAQAL